MSATTIKSYVGDIGTRIRLTLNTDLSLLSSAEMQISKPNGDIKKSPAVVEDALNGIVYYDTVEGDFNQIGIYKVQVKTTFTSGDIFKSKTVNFEVFDAFK